MVRRRSARSSPSSRSSTRRREPPSRSGPCARAARGGVEGRDRHVERQHEHVAVAQRDAAVRDDPEVAEDGDVVRRPAPLDLAGRRVERPDVVVVRRHVQRPVRLDRVRLLAAADVRVERVEVDGEAAAERVDVARGDLRERRVPVLVGGVAESGPADIGARDLARADADASTTKPARPGRAMRPPDDGRDSSSVPRSYASRRPMAREQSRDHEQQRQPRDVGGERVVRRARRAGRESARCRQAGGGTPLRRRGPSSNDRPSECRREVRRAARGWSGRADTRARGFRRCRRRLRARPRRAPPAAGTAPTGRTARPARRRSPGCSRRR